MGCKWGFFEESLWASRTEQTCEFIIVAFTNARKVLGQGNSAPGRAAPGPAAPCRSDWYCPFVTRHVKEELLKRGASGCGEGRAFRGLADSALAWWTQPRPGFMRSPKVTGTHPPQFNFP